MRSKAKPKSETTDSALIPAVGYIRMSTDDQKESPERQKGEVLAMAERDGYQVLRWYEDHGMTGTESKNRPEFQRMMADMKNGDFRAVLVYEPSRFSREDFFDAAEHWKVLKNCKVRLVSVVKGEMKLDQLSDQIMALIGQNESHNESRRIAERSLSGRIQKARKGVHFGPTPWGYDREFLDESGQVVKRAASWERFSCPQSWTMRLVPSSDPAVLDGLRFIFDSIIEGKPLRAIARGLNQRGLRTARGNMFSLLAVKRIVRNPIYQGLTRFGANPTGKFDQVEELIVVAGAHQALVSASTFEAANGVLQAAYKSGGNAPPGTFPLSRILVCGHCGRGMTGHRENYECKGTLTGIEVCSERISISAQAIESMILRLIAEKVLCEENRGRLCEALDRMSMANNASASAESAQLTEIQSKIARGERNLAAVEDLDDLSAISKCLKEWREQEKKLQDRIRKLEKESRSASQPGSMLGTPEALKALREHLHLAERSLLTMALRKTIQSITIKREAMEPEFPCDIAVYPIFGEVQFFPELCPTPFEFGDADLWPGRAYLNAAQYVNDSGRYVRRAELAEVLEITEECAMRHAKRAVRFGLIGYRKLGRAYVFEPLTPIQS